MEEVGDGRRVVGKMYSFCPDHSNPWTDISEPMRVGSIYKYM